MKGYLGEEVVDISTTSYKNCTPVDWIKMWISDYSYIDGAEHKQWLIDQILRIACGTPIIMRIARWSNGHIEERFSLGEPSEKYLEYQRFQEFDTGIAP